jgi:protein SCO1/2
MGRYGHPGTENGWHFLTGTPESIEKFTKAIGFKYAWDEKTKQYAHAGGVQIATPEGKLARYFYGIEYAPKELKLGLIESANSKIGTPVDQLLLYCYHYDPSTGKYGLAIMNVVRLGGILTLAGLAAMFLVMWRYNGNKRAATEKTAR